MAEISAVPTINHVAISVPKDLVSPAGRERVLAFWGPLLGWKEIAEWTLPRCTPFGVGHLAEGSDLVGRAPPPEPHPEVGTATVRT